MARALLSVEGISDANLQVGDAYSVLSVHGANPSGARGGSDNSREDRNKSNSNDNNRKDRGDSRGNRDNRGNRGRDYRSGGGRSGHNERRNHPNYDPTRPDIGAMCGRYNAGMPCQESSCR